MNRPVAVRDLVAALDAELDIRRFQDGQENGLQVEGRREAQRVATAVSVNEATIQAAIDWNADVLLTHHGLLWNNQPPHVRGVRRQRLKQILEADLNVVSYQLPIDAHPTLGNNAALADAAGCRSHGPAFPYKGGPAIGTVGLLPEARLFEEWVQDFEVELRRGCGVDTGPFQVWPTGQEKIRSIGFVSGAAPYQVQDAIDQGLDVYVTGEPAEAVYHLAREAGIHFIAGGHYLTERLGVRRLGEWVAKRMGVTHRFFDVETRA